jgi:hypothetical protein
MQKENQKFWMSVMTLAGLCLIVIGCAGCGFASLWTVGSVALSSVGVAMASLSKVLTPAQSAAITGAIAKIQALWNDLKTAVTAYTTSAAEGTLEAVTAVVAAIQTALPDVEAAANIGNPIVQAVIAAVLSSVGGVLTYVAQNVIPKASTAMVDYKAGNSKTAAELDAVMTLQAKKSRSDFESAIAASGLDAATIKSINGKMEHETHLHLGPIRI